MTETPATPATPGPHLFHIVDAGLWADAVAVGEYVPASLAAEGFVHCSYARQVHSVADARYAGVPGLVVVELDPAGWDVRDEDSYGGGVEYPHVYGPLPTSAAVAVHPLTVFRDGTVLGREACHDAGMSQCGSLADVQGDTFGRLLHLLNRLDAAHIYYRLEHTRPDSLMIDAVAPGWRWEIEFMSDGSIDIERYRSVAGVESDPQLIEDLFRFDPVPDGTGSSHS